MGTNIKANSRRRKRMAKEFTTTSTETGTKESGDPI